ncbi:c-type cytochrome [Dongia sedimenti]|uniref:Cytochrome c n=1 Tax=Dongia sedimenti TaxID=3064282 RepID=A0ABU0YGV4_9PROT|nr:cytochrome c [Rhodospirillaceae bacterium R-7]
MKNFGQPKPGKWITSATFTVALLVATGSLAWADGNAKTGALLARHWCAACHGLDGGIASDAAPPLETIAQRAHEGASWLRAWLANPHPPMPNFTLSRSEIDDIVAYLETLAAQ